MKRLSSWLKLALIPLAANLVLWQLVYIPKRAALQGWKQTSVLVETRPNVEALLKESREIQVSWEPTRFSRKDSSAAVEAIRQLAGRYNLRVQKLQMQELSRGRKGKPAAGKNAPAKISGLSAISITLELAGSFSQMLHWISDLEAQYGFQIDSWQMTGATEPNQPTKMTVQVTAFLGDSPSAIGLAPLPAQASLDDIERTARQLSKAMKSYRDQEKERWKSDAVFLRDPMQALVDLKGKLIVSAVAREKGPWLQGIIWSDTQPLIAVGEQLFSEGDVAGPYKIIKIYPDRVVVQKDDQQETISLDRWTE